MSSAAQNSSMTQVKRAQKKCGECRKRKIKCTPCDRDFETTGRKCDSCEKHGLPCGPDVKKSDDPLACQKDDSGAEKQLPVEEALEDNVRDATSNQARLNCLLKALRHASQLPPICCKLPTDKQRINHNDFPKLYVETMISKARSLFVDNCRKGQQLHKDSKSKDAFIIVLKLVIALQEYPELCDDTIIGALGMMAEFFKDMGDTQGCEWVLEKASSIYNVSKHPYIEDPCKALVGCLSESSRCADEFLPELFKNNLMDDGARKVVIPAIPLAQLAALCSNAKILDLVAASSDSMEHPAPGLFNLEALHLAAASGREDTLRDLLRKVAPVDDKDLHNHTALFMAALKGHKGCCEALLEWRANPNEKDSHGTSILEVAVKGGHFEVVKLLVEAEADLNPTRPCPCTPSLLAAAIKSSKSALDIVTYLLKKGAIVDKTAIDLATENELDVLAQTMLQLQQTQQENLAFFEPDRYP